MAVRRGPEGGFRGGIARWVTPAEVRRLADAIYGLTSGSELFEWGYETPLGELLGERGDPGFGWARYGCEGARLSLVSNGPEVDTPLTDEDREKALRLTIAELAAKRLDAALREYADGRRLSLPALYGRGDSGGLAERLAPCPACDAPPGGAPPDVALDRRGWGWSFYCRDHWAEEQAELGELLVQAGRA